MHVTQAWYVVCESKQLRDKPLPITLLNTPIVVFRNREGKIGALLDRCPHRNVPLSLGNVQGEYLQCVYHGWQFDCAGACQAIPELFGEANAVGRRAPAFATREQDGFIWVYATPDVTPQNEPFHFPFIHKRDYTTVRQEVRAPASIHATAENALDVPHTAYLHGGLFRSAKAKRHDIEVVIRRWPDRVEAEYVGEPRPSGLAGKILAPGGGTVKHFDRFILPSIVQVEYRLGEKSHICVSTALTPVSDFDTRLFAVTSFNLPLSRLAGLVALFLRPLALRIFQQDADMLKRQTETIQHFGGEQFVSTDVDVLGAQIYRLLKQAERGATPAAIEPVTRTIRMRI